MRTRSTKVLLTLVAFALFAASCGGGGSDDTFDAASSDTSATDSGSESPDSNNGNDETPPPTDAPPATDAPDALPPGVSTGGTAVISLENGEVFEFSILCALEPQPNFEYTIVSYDDPANLDISKWSEDSQFSGVTVSIYDSTSYDTIWEAGSFYRGPEGEPDLTLSGSTLSGSGIFWPGDDSKEDVGVQGEILANC
ncbi:MAG: hypothetical protein ACC652_02545 [Acidimicrobiales bacterium]